jgi:SNF2 family DNA or RNA helicase
LDFVETWIKRKRNNKESNYCDQFEYCKELEKRIQKYFNFFNKLEWLGDERIKPLVAIPSTTKVTTVDIIKDFKNGPSPVLIISYDLCVRNADLLQECRCDLLVCDEGHKLKNKNIKIYTALKGIKTPRKIILSGTPLQNNLDEFFCVVDFINPGLLVGGDAHAFTNLFTNPIAKSREPNASKNDVKVGREREKALNDLTNLFILRRTNKLLTKLLPPKSTISILIIRGFNHFLWNVRTSKEIVQSCIEIKNIEGDAL